MFDCMKGAAVLELDASGTNLLLFSACDILLHIGINQVRPSENLLCFDVLVTSQQLSQLAT